MPDADSWRALDASIRGDVYHETADKGQAVLEPLVDILELRLATPEWRGMLDAYVQDMNLASARILEVGCGTGAVARILASRPDVASVTGVDPSAFFIEKSIEFAAGRDDLSFQVADGRALPFADDAFDAVIIHTVISHVDQPEDFITEAFRVLRPGGRIGVFDGDYISTTISLSENDRLQQCVDVTVRMIAHDPWIARRMLPIVNGAGFQACRPRSHSYLETHQPHYLRTFVERGAVELARIGAITSAESKELIAESDGRIDRGLFYGHINYFSVTGIKPAH